MNQSAAHPVINWTEAGEEKSARWRTESGRPPPKHVVIADDRMTADTAYRLACEGHALLWRGDFQNARQLLQAMARRIDKKPRKSKPHAAIEAFNLHRLAQSQRARTLGMLLLPVNADHRIVLRRAPDVSLACSRVYGAITEPYVLSLRGLLGLIGAHEWRKNGVDIAPLGARIHPHYGVFSPIRGEYLALVNDTPLPELRQGIAFDIGTGTGVLAAILARRGVQHIVATDQDPRALACARENLSHLGYASQVEVLEADLFPEGRASLIVCNPPWLPARPSTALESAIYDPDSQMLKGVLNGLAAHLDVGGEGWLILSDLAEHLGLRSREALLQLIEKANLQVVAKIDVKPHHPKVAKRDDPLHAARRAELTSLWRLAVK
ncbi:MAG: class I SAM-dependent methyltransferase [Gallionella sp.]